VTDANPNGPPTSARSGVVLLRRSGLCWFLVAALGQTAFIWMIVAHYGRKTLASDFAGWNDKPLIKGYVPGDDAGNLMFGVHVLLAAVVTLGGLLQLIPAIRQRVPVLHRWNGRLFIVIACVMAVGGLWMTWVRPTYLSQISAIAITLNAGLILLFAIQAFRMARARRFDDHRRWAMRAFLAVNGVWFLRVALMAWVMISGGGIGMNSTFSGPADLALQFGAYLLPVAILELYFRAQDSRSPARKRWTAGLIILATGLTAVGVAGAIAFMWGPYMI
tara:strand:+ start:1499 stop:2326 length:828 start_codon:yes stop_codon:yes gene_type:complete